MEAPPHAPWNPDRRWADPAILILALLVLLAVQAGARRPSPPPTSIRATGRILEIQTAAQDLLGHPLRAVPLTSPLTAWDRALASVLAAEAGDLETGRRLALEGPLPPGPGSAFRRTWSAAYRNDPPPSKAEREEVLRALGSGWAAHRLAARLSGDPQRARHLGEARSWALGRVVLLGTIGLAVLLLTLAGLVALPLLALTRPAQRSALPTWSLSGRALLLVVLLWFLGLRLSGTVAMALVAPLGLPRVWMLPVAFLLHASLGLGLLSWAEGRSLRTILAPLWTGSWLRAAGWAAAFLAATLPIALTVGFLMSRLMGSGETPQQELRELIGAAHGWGATLAIVLTVAVLAPLFEEILFRGFLLPWIQTRTTPRWPTAMPVLLTGLLFGAMHLQPRGLPILATLGSMLGWALVRSGDLRTAILIHGAWNGGVFLLVKTLS